MRKTLFIVFLSLVCLFSCESLLTDYSSSSETVVSNSIKNDHDSAEYHSQAYSVNYANEPIDSGEKILVFCDSGDFMFQREVETSMVDAFHKNGVTAIAYSSVEIESLPSSFDYLFEVSIEKDCRYILVVGISDLYTYEYGGGIKQFTFDSATVDTARGELSLRISGAIDCSENDFSTLYESLKPAGNCLATSVVDEYLSFIESLNVM